MPAVTANPRLMSDGTKVTEFVDVVNTAGTTYTYPTSQDYLMVVNTGYTDLMVTVGNDTSSVTPKQTKTIDSSFLNFTIKSSSGICSFKSTAVQNGTDVKTAVNSVVTSLNAPVKYELPAEFTWRLPIDIYVTGYRAATRFNVENLKNISTNTYYVDPVNGLDTYNGLTWATAFKSAKKAHDTAINGDTIYLANGRYPRSSNFNAQITKSLNVIAPKGNAMLATYDILTYTKTTGQTNVYQANRSGVDRVIKVDANNDITNVYTNVASIALCDATEGSWYTDGTILYVHDYGHGSPTADTIAILSTYNISYTELTTGTAGHTLYLQGIKAYGGIDGALQFRNNHVTNSSIVVAKDCTFACGTGNANNVKVYSQTPYRVESYFENCKSLYSHLDGFNYVSSKSLELNCEAHYNGSNLYTNNTNNATTAHVGAKVIRINGVYSNSTGANVADVQTDTQTVNVCCVSMDSASALNNYKCDFDIQQSGTTMWLFRCSTYKSKSITNIRNVTGSTLYVEDCIYNTISIT